MAFTLPALPYDAAALEPHIGAQTMQIHHGKHHQAYVNNLNAAIEKHPELAGKSLDELMAAEASATRDALGEAGRPVCEIVLPVLDESALGALMMHFMLETVIIALCSNIDPFNQPSVERGKVLARDNLRHGRS